MRIDELDKLLRVIESTNDHKQLPALNKYFRLFVDRHREYFLNDDIGRKLFATLNQLHAVKNSRLFTENLLSGIKLNITV